MSSEELKLKNKLANIASVVFVSLTLIGIIVKVIFL
jgi:hypothetical protein